MWAFPRDKNLSDNQRCNDPSPDRIYYLRMHSQKLFWKHHDLLPGRMDSIYQNLLSCSFDHSRWLWNWNGWKTSSNHYSVINSLAHRGIYNCTSWSFLFLNETSSRIHPRIHCCLYLSFHLSSCSHEMHEEWIWGFRGSSINTDPDGHFWWYRGYYRTKHRNANCCKQCILRKR